jgi:hypothetical protein
MTAVYCLYSSLDGIPRYVGKTEEDPERRLKRYIARALEEHDRSALYAWMRDVFRRGHLVEMHVLQREIAPKEGDMFERYWMSQFPDLLNTGVTEPRATELSPVAAQVVRGLQELIAAQRRSGK